MKNEELTSGLGDDTVYLFVVSEGKYLIEKRRDWHEQQEDRLESVDCQEDVRVADQCHELAGTSLIAVKNELNIPIGLRKSLTKQRDQEVSVGKFPVGKRS
jgi:hypothetical protein